MDDVSCLCLGSRKYVGRVAFLCVHVSVFPVKRLFEEESLTSRSKPAEEGEPAEVDSGVECWCDFVY